MGTDIHGVFQRKTSDGAWQDVPSKYDFDRHYQLFAVLAGVRNGVGFAGVPTGDPVRPIAEPRGLPADFEVVQGDLHPIASEDLLPPYSRKYWTEEDPLELWMGGHPYSWLLADEMLKWSPPGNVGKTGVLSREQYLAWDKVSPPESYCGRIWGANVVMAPNADWTHIQVSWGSDLRHELDYFFAEVRRLVEEHGDIRFVFGFDN